MRGILRIESVLRVRSKCAFYGSFQCACEVGWRGSRKLLLATLLLEYWSSKLLALSKFYSLFCQLLSEVLECCGQFICTTELCLCQVHNLCPVFCHAVAGFFFALLRGWFDLLGVPFFACFCPLIPFSRLKVDCGSKCRPNSML